MSLTVTPVIKYRTIININKDNLSAWGSKKYYKTNTLCKEHGAFALGHLSVHQDKFTTHRLI